MHIYDVIIIGAGTSGLTARREVAKKTQNYVLIDKGPLGTTCARVGCMPSKVLIQVANDLHQHKKLVDKGLVSGPAPAVHREAIMDHVRSLRDRFVRGVLGGMPEWEDKFIKGQAKFIDQETIVVNGTKIKGKKIIIATGSRPILPEPWLKYKEFFLSSDEIFEQKVLPEKLLVVGLGVIGLELGQAMSRLGVQVTGVSRGKRLGGLTDPIIQDYVYEKFSSEFQLFKNGVEFVGDNQSEKISAMLDGKVHKFDKVLLAVGRTPNIDLLGFENTGIQVNEKGLPEIDLQTMSLRENKNLFLPGDVNTDRPILHEAADQGYVAGFNTVNDEACFKRRTPLGITFSDPNIASVGQKYSWLQSKGVDFITGKVSFEGQGRSIVKLKEQGLLHIYAEKDSGRILGAEMQAPDGEHLAHLLAWVISLDMTVFEVLKMPFYHPVVEEGLRTALRNAARQICKNTTELLRCEGSPS